MTSAPRAGCNCQSLRLVVQVCDSPAPSATAQPNGIQPNRIRSGIAADHENFGFGLRGKLWTDGSPPVREIVTCTCDGDRIDTLRKLHEHGVCVRNEREVGQESSPFKATHRAEAVG